MRYLRYGFLALVAIVLVSVAVANREPVTLRLLTDDMASLVGLQTSITLPLFLVIFIGIVAGILIGFVWEWFREHKQRVEAGADRKEKHRLQREMGRLKKNKAKPEDDVLALLEP
jgi:putative membrane protein